MTDLTLRDNVTPLPMKDLETRLMALTQYGRPRVVLLDNGWYAVVEMYIKVTGGEFKVASEFGMSSPSAALAQCEERIAEAFKQMRDVVK